MGDQWLELRRLLLISRNKGEVCVWTHDTISILSEDEPRNENNDRDGFRMAIWGKMTFYKSVAHSHLFWFEATRFWTPSKYSSGPSVHRETIQFWVDQFLQTSFENWQLKLILAFTEGYKAGTTEKIPQISFSKCRASQQTQRIKSRDVWSAPGAHGRQN